MFPTTKSGMLVSVSGGRFAAFPVDHWWAQGHGTVLDRPRLVEYERHDSGASVLADALSRISSFTSLDLSWANLGDACAYSLADAMQMKHVTLTDIDLRGNRIGVDGVLALAAALKFTTSLTTLGLRENPIEMNPAQFSAFHNSLQQNASLTYVDLIETRVRGPQVLGVFELMRRNRFALSSCRISVSYVRLCGRYSSLGRDVMNLIADALWETRGAIEWLRC